MKTRNYRTELKALSTEQLEREVEFLLNKSLDVITAGMKESASTPVRTKLTYAKELLAKRKAGDEAKHTQEELIVFVPEKAPEYCAVLDLKDREMIYLGKDKKKAERIVKSVNMHDELIRFIKMISIHDEHFLSQDSFNTREDCEREIIHLAKKAKQLLEQAEQK